MRLRPPRIGMPRPEHYQMSITPSERFLAKIDRTGECWIWVGARNQHGYGVFYINGADHRAHRVSWFLHYGEWPASPVLHTCDTPPCVRPDHLFLGTQADNMRDASAKGRSRNQYSSKEIVKTNPRVEVTIA